MDIFWNHTIYNCVPSCSVLICFIILVNGQFWWRWLHARWRRVCFSHGGLPRKEGECWLCSNVNVMKLQSCRVWFILGKYIVLIKVHKLAKMKRKRNLGYQVIVVRVSLSVSHLFVTHFTVICVLSV